MGKLLILALVGLALMGASVAQVEPLLRVRGAGRIRQALRGPEISEDVVNYDPPAQGLAWAPETEATAAAMPPPEADFVPVDADAAAAGSGEGEAPLWQPSGE